MNSKGEAFFIESSSLGGHFSMIKNITKIVESARYDV